MRSSQEQEECLKYLETNEVAVRREVVVLGVLSFVLAFPTLSRVNLLLYILNRPHHQGDIVVIRSGTEEM